MPPKKKGVEEPKVTVPDGDAVAGRDIFEQQCAACHALEGDDKTASAPTLGTISGRKAGAIAFKYSKAMAGSGIEWSDKHLFVFLKNPSKHVPGTQMSFAGIPSDKDRADLIAFLLGK